MDSHSKIKKCLIRTCEVPLGIRNKSGYCERHIRYGASCKKCNRIIYRGYNYCYQCSALAKSINAKVVVPCQFPGCKLTTCRKTKLCRTHFYNYYQCESPGCANRVCFTSKYRLCVDHHGIARKLRRLGIKEYPNTPHTITKKRVRSMIIKLQRKA